MGLEDMQQNQVQAPAREEPFYRRTWFCVLMAIIFPPLGIVLMWVFKKPTAQSARIALTVVSAVILIGAIGNMGTARALQDELFGTTVEKAWETAEAKGYTVAFKSPTGADLNPGRSSMHSSTMQTWRVRNVSVVESTKTVTLWVTTKDEFIEEYGEGAMKG